MEEPADEMQSKVNGDQEIPPEDKLPPELTKCRRIFLHIANAGMVVGALYIGYFCINILQKAETVPVCNCCAYIALSVFLSGLITNYLIRHEIRVHRKRKEDRSEIDALIEEARSIQPRLIRPKRPKDFDKKRVQIENEINRLTEDIGPAGWTEFQVLILDRLLIDFLSIH